MILAEKIMMLRKKNGWSQEDLANELNISRQSVSKWESGASIPDLDKILKMSALFGVSTDYLLKDEIETITYSEGAEKDSSDKREITLEDANIYMNLIQNVAGKIAFAVALLILSPACMIELAALSEYTSFISENAAGGIGVAVLLVLVAFGVAILILNGMKLSPYEYLEKESFTLQYGVEGIVTLKKKEQDAAYRLAIVIGVVLCIVGVIPLILAACTENDYLLIHGVIILLAFIAVGVFFMIRVGMVRQSYDKLLQDGDYTPEKKEIGKRIGFFPGAYWCTATAIYLGISFYTEAWDRSWIVWPVAGVLYAAVYGIISAVAKSKR